MSNLKIDIIYYKTSSDFEMEFNLSGCCRMRMFKDKVDSHKGLINTLARDVSRSKIIFVVTDLFGENSAVPIVSKAIGLPLVSPDKTEYGIKTADQIQLPKTAVPLVTKAGIYGGFIIESGPQSIIIISSVRSLRHEVMKAYVHNYVFDIGQILAYQTRVGGSHSAMPNFAHQPEPVNADHAQAEETDSIANPDDSPEQNIPENSALEVEPKIYKNTGIVPESENETPSVVPGISSTAEIDIFSGYTAEPEKNTKKSHRVSNIVLLVVVILMLIGFGILAYFFVYLPLIGQPAELTNQDNNIVAEFLYSLFE